MTFDSSIGVIDYGGGNIRSLIKALETLGAPPRRVTSPDQVEDLDLVFFPGQGASPPAMAALWGRILEREAREDGARWTLALDNAEIRFVAVGDDRGPGIRAVDLAAANAPAIAAAARARGLPGDDGAVTLCGTVFHLVAS